MKNENTQKTLEAQILNCKKRLKELAPDIELDEEKSKEYNKVIVQKAILVDRYKKLCFKPSFLTRVKEAIKTNPFKKKEKLICDYFLS
ncbi:MAG: hypothetical protein IJ877_04100 [Candidatus Gastranaerophilales bacterium]|nr:hypothetical protein [Candidatus Gastranaerophilales bacterium]